LGLILCGNHTPIPRRPSRTATWRHPVKRRLVFYGDGSGAFVAVDATSGRLLWHFGTGQSWKAGPMSYTIDGKQYIGMTAGATIMVFGLR
jgi:outer membrane protein assembly factor BamB